MRRLGVIWQDASGGAASPIADPSLYPLWRSFGRNPCSVLLQYLPSM